MGTFVARYAHRQAMHGFRPVPRKRLLQQHDALQRVHLVRSIQKAQQKFPVRITAVGVQIIDGAATLRIRRGKAGGCRVDGAQAPDVPRKHGLRVSVLLRVGTDLYL